MKPIIILASILGLTAGCAGSIDNSIDNPLDPPIESEAPAIAIDPDAISSAEPDEPAPPGVVHAPTCGDGPITYFDWVCRPLGWTLVAVGHRDYHCMGPPYYDALVGRTTTCYSSERDVCGGGNDPSVCYYQQCNLPRPTTPCLVGTPVGNG